MHTQPLRTTARGSNKNVAIILFFFGNIILEQTRSSNNKDAIIVAISGDNPSFGIHADTHRTRMTSDENILDKSSIRLEHSDWVGGEVVGNQDIIIRINEEVVGL